MIRFHRGRIEHGISFSVRTCMCERGIVFPCPVCWSFDRPVFYAAMCLFFCSPTIIFGIGIIFGKCSEATLSLLSLQGAFYAAMFWCFNHHFVTNY
jgi:hypothetical protein